jgi:hypothetical protein
MLLIGSRNLYAVLAGFICENSNVAKLIDTILFHRCKLIWKLYCTNAYEHTHTDTYTFHIRPTSTFCKNREINWCQMLEHHNITIVRHITSWSYISIYRAILWLRVRLVVLLQGSLLEILHISIYIHTTFSITFGII